MKTDNTVLHLTVGEPMEASLARATAAMKAARQGKHAQPYLALNLSLAHLVVRCFVFIRRYGVRLMRVGDLIRPRPLLFE